MIKQRFFQVLDAEVDRKGIMVRYIGAKMALLSPGVPLILQNEILRAPHKFMLIETSENYQECEFEVREICPKS